MRAVVTKFCLYLVFLVALSTGLGDLIGGVASIPGVSSAIPASVDNELRCLAVFWLFFGVFCFWVVRNLDKRGAFIPAIALTLLVSGLARLLSIVIVGMPSTILFVAMIVEFVISISLYVSHRKTAHTSK